MDERIRQTSRFVRDVVQDATRQTFSDHGDSKYQEGFTSAAGISLRLVQDEIDTFREQMKSPGLSKPEQALYAHLEELKSKIEAGFDCYWRGTSVDWHPPKPIAKGVIRRAGESQP